MTVILNRQAGPGNDDQGEAVRSAFARCGLEANIVRAPDGEGLRAAARAAAQGPDEIVVAGGGDGTIGLVAGELVAAGKTLGVLPLGTLNHFAKDLGLPAALDGAVQTIAHGRTALVDVGEVNGKVFLNNSSLGLYPHLVRHREAQQTRFGRGKWAAFARSALYALRRYPFLHLRLTVGGQTLERKTAFLFLGNNEYEFTGFNAGGRACLDAGRLGLCLAHRTGRLGLLRLVFRALIGRLAQAKDFETFCVDEATVETRRPSLLVAADGEITRMTAPLHYRVHHKALRVRVPNAAAEAAF